MITGKQRSRLRGMANALEPIFQIGKGGIGENLAEQVSLALEARELVKISVLDTADISAREAGDILAKRLGAEVVQSIGRKFVLYRKSKENQRIVLD
ncbi:MAG: RNA-binding protein YhbY [Firmicutes bacterium ADurb.Bin182]|nr:MAG: RNA-binding protein YhbY [Firmicutes bacterium ADurb.Bin182]